jgi:hypothetical protein
MSTVYKTTEAQRRAQKTYIKKNRDKANIWSKTYYDKNREEICKKRRAKYASQKKAKAEAKAKLSDVGKEKTVCEEKSPKVEIE